MAGSIGAVSSTFVRGTVPPKSQRVDLFELPGVNGYGAHLLGLGDSEFELTLVQFGSQATLTAWFVALKALRGTVVSITTDLGVTVTGCLVTEIGTMQVAAAAWALGSLTDRRGEVRLKGVTT